MSNIGIVTTWFERGAAYVSKQYMEVLQKEHNVFIYARGGETYAKGDPNWDGENVTWGKKVITPFSTTLINKRDFIKWIRSNNISVVIFNEQRWWYPLLWCKEMGVRTVAYVDYYTEYTIPLYGVYDLLICNTKKHLKAFDWHKGARYIPWGTDTNTFCPPATISETDMRTVRLFHSCGMNPKRKGTDLLLRALEKIKNKNFKLIIHTQTSLRKFYPDLTELIDRYESHGKLVVIERTVTAPGLYYMGDVYVYPSRLEGIGLTIAEAVSSGLGLIVPDCGPMNEFIQPSFGKAVAVETYYSRGDGYYWPANEVNVDDLAKRIDEFLSQPDNLQEIKNSARNYALAHLDWSKNSPVLNKMLTELMNTEFPTYSNTYDSLIRKFESKGLKTLNHFAMQFSTVFEMYKRFRS